MAGFEEFCQSLIPNFMMPDKKTVLKEVSLVYADLRKNILYELEAAGKISLCVDEWTKKGMTWSVIGVTAHFFNKKTQKMERILLGMPQIDHPHTAEKIRDMTTSILNDWKIPKSKIWRIITDNAKNITKAFHTVSLGDDEYHYYDFDFDQREAEAQATAAAKVDPKDAFLEEEDEEYDEDTIDEYLADVDTGIIQASFDRQKHLPCFIHTLVLVFKKTVDSEASEVLDAKKDVHRLIGYFSKSSEVTKKLKGICGHKLFMPSRTRWNYDYQMIKHLVDIRKHLTTICEAQLINNLQNWGVLVQLIDVLTPFARWVDKLQGQTYSTIMYALPCLKDLLTHLEEKINKNVLAKLCTDIIDWIKSYFKYILEMGDQSFNPTFLVAALLHPTLALTLQELQRFRARQELQILLRSEANTEIPSPDQPSFHIGSQSSQVAKKEFCGSLFTHLHQQILQARQSCIGTVTTADDEINNYFKQLPTFPEIEDPLKFWTDNKLLFPALSKVACDVLAIPASSAAVESVFSVAGHETSGQ